MKKLGSIFLCIVAFSLLLTGCPLGGPAEPQVAAAPDILIIVPELKPGMTVGQIPVEVTLNGEPTSCTAEWVIFSEDGYAYMEPTDVIPEGYYGRLDVTYFLPKGVEVSGDLPITLNAPGGTYDGTGEGATNEEGCHAAWSHIMYEFPKAVAAPDILITVPELKPGMTVGQIPVEVTLNGEPADCTTSWVIFSEDGYAYMEPTDTIPEGYHGRLDVTYFLPKGVEVTGDLPVTLNAPGGTYDGTGEGATNEEGCHAAWSHIMYEFPKAVAAPDILITVPELKPGMTVGQIPVEVTLNGEPTSCTTSWVIFSEDGFAYMEPTDTIPEGYHGRLDVTYFLPKGVEVSGDLPVTLNAPGGTYDGTGEGATNEEGCHAAWSHIMYEFSKTENPHTHDWKTNKAKSEAATCEDDGLKYLECSCGKHKTSKIKATGHDYEGKVTKEPTCEQTGVRTYTCKNCGDSYTEKIKENGHDYSGKVTKEPTCEESGMRTYTCKDCGDSYEEEIEANGHSKIQEVIKLPTCTGRGQQRITCKNCDLDVLQGIMPKGHSWGRYMYSNNKEHARQCEVCKTWERQEHTLESGGHCPICDEYIIN